MATWLAIRKPVTGLRGVVLKCLAFLIPVGIWCAVSYCPFIWHPLIEVTVAGDSGFEVGATCPPEFFASNNALLFADGKAPAQGIRANPPHLPPPHKVATALYTAFTTEPTLRGEKWFHESLLQSAKLIFWGFALAMVIAIPLGILCGTFDALAKMIEPLVDFVRYMPPPTFGALMVAVWGIFEAPKIAIIFIGCFFNMVLVSANTARSLDASMIEAAQTLGARRLGIITHVILPGILPGIYRDMRITLGAAWTFLTAAELVGAMSGLSEFINQQGKHQHFDNVYAGIIVIGAIGFFVDRILAFFATILFPWTPEANHKLRHWFRWLSYFARKEAERPHRSPYTRPSDRAVGAAPADDSPTSAATAGTAKELTHAGA